MSLHRMLMQKGRELLHTLHHMLYPHAHKRHVTGKHMSVMQWLLCWAGLLAWPVITGCSAQDPPHICTTPQTAWQPLVLQ